jgi:hypothetical protein
LGALALVLGRRAQFASADRLPVLERLLARGEGFTAPADAEHPILARWFELPRRPWPFAAMLREAERGDGRRGTWLRVDPAWAQVDVTAARLMAVGTLGLDEEEARALRAAVAPLFGDRGIALEASHPDHWYVVLPEGSPFAGLEPPWRMLGQDLRAGLPSSRDALRWTALLNECQAVLHDHAVNRRRAAQGKPPANSLWFWGAGAWPARITARVGSVASSDPLFVALGRAAGIAIEAVPRPAGAEIALADLRASPDAQAVERDWLSPAWRALRRGRIDRVTVQFADGSGSTCTRAQAFAFWRRPRPLA